jgi:hypothetical protein
MSKEGAQGEIAGEIDRLLELLLVGADPKQAMLARNFNMAMQAAAIHGAGEIPAELAKRADDWRAGLNAFHRAKKTGQQRRVWEFVIDRRGKKKYLQGENVWSEAAAEFHISKGRARSYYYAERKARVARGSPGDSRFPDDGQRFFEIDASAQH